MRQEKGKGVSSANRTFIHTSRQKNACLLGLLFLLVLSLVYSSSYGAVSQYKIEIVYIIM